MLVVGFLMGWRFEQGFLKMAIGVVLALAFGYAFSWGDGHDRSSRQDAGGGAVSRFPPNLPSRVRIVDFRSRWQTMPGWLQGFAENQPISVIATTVRSLMISESNLPFLGIDQGEMVIKSVLWTIAIVAVFAPLAVRQYRRSVG